MKKYKLFVFAIAIAIMSVITVNAREMTISELGQEAIDQYKESDQDVGYIYVIGEYAFTSQYDIKTEDIMLAAKSINLNGQTPVKFVEDSTELSDAYKKMVINTIRAKVDDDFNISGWEISDAAVGTANLVAENKFNIRYIDYVFQAETSKADIKFDKATEDNYQSYLNKDFGISDVSVLYDELTYTDGKLSGLILRHEIQKGFPDKDKTGYYLPFVIEVPDLREDTIVTIEEDSKVTATYNNFDIQNKADGKNPGIIVLWSIPGENGKKSINIVVDIDGDKDEYGPTTYTIDYTDLRFQGESKIEDIKLNNAHESDKATLTSWGYNFDKNKDKDGKAPTLTKNGDDFSYKLTGTLVEQKLNEKAYGSDKADAYYFDFTFVLENNSDKKAVIKALNGDYGNAKTHTQDEYDENGNLTILQRISKNTKCDNDNKANCIAKFEIDLDGDGKEYYPTIYTIDYSEVILEKASLVEMSEVSLENIDDKWNGFEEDESYSTTFTTEGDVVKVTGLITIFDDKKWDEGNNPFESGAYDYYLAFKLKKSEATGTQVNETVKFLTDGSGDGEQNEITDTDFGENDEIYVLKYINPFKLNTTKKFTIKVDLDGTGDNYAPYVLTVDWSELEFQQESQNTEVKPLTTIETSGDKTDPQYIEETDKSQVQSWGFDFDKDSDLNIKSTGINTSELTGTVKEQTVEGAGFKTSKGYFILVKIYGPKAKLLKGTVLDTEEGTKKWTIKLQDEEDKWKTIKPSEKDYENGFITVLFRLDEKDKKVKYIIDYDGDEDYFLPHEETITYDNLTFKEAQEVKVNGSTEENVSIYLGEPIPTEILTQLEKEQVDSIDEELQPYRDFTYFTTTDGTPVDNTTPVTEDMLSDGSINLTPHWNLYSDKFVADVLKDLNNTEDSKSADFSTEFAVEDYVENSGEITINVINPDVKVSRMNETSIPGAIAHILLEDEIKEITLVADSSNSKTFTKGDASDKDTLKGTIKEEVESLYSSILSSSFGGDENSITLSQLAQNDTYKTFTLKINPDNIADNVTLAKAPAENGISLASDITVPTEYKITFKSDIVSVNTLQLLKTALNGSAKTIFISDGFEVNEKLDVTRPVTINGDNKVLTANNTTDSIFNVTTSGVTIENLELKAGNASKTLISVTESGKLTTKQLKITSDDTNGLDAAIDVTSGGNVTITEMQYDKEHYNHPAVRAAKDNATVNLTDTEGNQANAIEKEKITEQLNGNDSTSKDEAYTSYRNYYNDSKNSRIYKTELYNYQAGARLSYIKYNYYNENVKIPKDIDPYKFSNFTYNGETYDLIAFSKNSFNILRGDENLLETDIAKDQLKATENDAHYWAVYKVTLQEGVKKVSSEDEFKQAVKDQETHAIYVSGTTDAPLEIDYTNENDGTFKIEKDLSIIGSSNLKVTIKAKKIETSADANNVLINRINLEVNAQENQQSLIDVNGNKLSLWQSSLKNIGTAVDYAIKYNSQTAVVDIRFMGRGSNGFKDSNINKSYIYVTGKLDEGSDLYSNEFPKIDGKTTTAIIIDGFTENAKVTEDEDGEPDIRFENNTVGTPYAIVFTKNTSGQQADIKLGNSTIKIGIEYADGKKNFEGIGLFANHDNVTITYINGDAEYQEQEQQPEDVQGPKFKSVITMVES